ERAKSLRRSLHGHVGTLSGGHCGKIAWPFGASVELCLLQRQCAGGCHSLTWRGHVCLHEIHAWPKSRPRIFLGDVVKLRLFLLGTLVALLPAQAFAQSTEQVVVYGTLADSSIGLARDKVAGSLQSLSAGQIGAGHGATVLTALGSQAAGVTLSDLQGNSLFQDLRFHGFEVGK